MSDTARAPRSNAPVALRIILAVLCLVPAAIGLVTLIVIFFYFLDAGFSFSSGDAVWMELFIGAAAIFILLPAIVIGVVLRFARWRRAPQASLVLAIVVTCAGVIATEMLKTTVVLGDMGSYILLMGFALAGIAVGALPPLLHWWNAADKA